MKWYTCHQVLPILGKCSLYWGTGRWFQTKSTTLHKLENYQFPHILKKCIIAYGKCNAKDSIIKEINLLYSICIKNINIVISCQKV